MTWFMNALAAVSLVVGIVATLSMLVLLMAASPNSKPEQLAVIYRWMLAFAGLGTISAMGGVLLAWYREPGWASLVGAVPVVASVAFIAGAFILHR